MSISTTLGNALTGLAAASRGAQVISSNVANATTEGYARREIELSARVTGGAGTGVQVDSVTRIVDENTLRELRLAKSAVGFADEPAAFLKSVLDHIGQPDAPSSLTAQVSGLEAALLAATSRPESDARLNAAVDAAVGLARKLNDVSDHVQTRRVDADRSIDLSVERLNTSLEQIAELNEQILRAQGSNRDNPSLLDSRQRLVDEVSDLVPIRQLPRDNGTVALYTMNGALLVDARPATFGFERTEPIIADMTQASGALSGLTLNGEPIQTAGDYSPIAGGRLSGLFQVRDEISVALQSDLDAMAHDLVSRFEDPTLDTTLTAGDPGLFTDRGSSLDLTNIVGLAGRISVNEAVLPAAGGAATRLRDGLGAGTPGPVGDAALLEGLVDRLQDARPAVGGTLSPTSRSVSDLAGDVLSLVGQDLSSRNSRLSFEQGRLEGLQDAMLAQGVDTDQELQKLLLIEQAYAANARVVQTADELLQLLIGL